MSFNTTRKDIRMTVYNKTNLDVYKTLDRNISHRDWYAHLFRWQHVLRIADIGMKILDVGTGPGELFETFYRNRYKPARFLGLDIRKKMIQDNLERWGPHGAEFKVIDVVLADLDCPDDWDLITSFELLEHVGKKNVPTVLDKLYEVASEKTLILISTPCYNGKDVAANHVIDGEIGELTFEEMKDLLEWNFEILEVFGTFASISDYKHLLKETPGLEELFEKMKAYYDSNALSIFFAPLFPAQSRNCLWKVRKKC